MKTYGYTTHQHELALEMNLSFDKFGQALTKWETETFLEAEKYKQRAMALRAGGVPSCDLCGLPLSDHAVTGRPDPLPSAVTIPNRRVHVDLDVIEKRAVRHSKKFFWSGPTNAGRQIEEARSFDRRIREGFRTMMGDV